jgi:outer membrane receptor protein involved in Fe transport
MAMSVEGNECRGAQARGELGVALTFKSALRASAIAVSLAAVPGVALAQDGDLGAEDEIVVTAEKRSQALNEVAMAISVLDAEVLQNRGAASLTDFAPYVPGLNISSGGTPGVGGIVIRGLATGFSNSFNAPLVSTYVDDLPVGGSAGGFGGSRGGLFSLDLMPYDIDQIEVLKGPQGTLYGAAAMGGIIKYAMTRPDLDEFEVRAGGDLANAYDSEGLDWGARGSVNLPILTDRLAVRFSGYYRDVAGWIDNIGTGVEDANSSLIYGGRFSALWQATDNIDVRFSAMSQRIESDDRTGVVMDGASGDTLFGRSVQDTNFPQGFEQQAAIYALQVNWDTRFGTFTNSSSYTYLRNVATQDLSAVPYVPSVPDALIRYTFTDRLEKYINEARFTSPDDQFVEWMVGAFYTKEVPEEWNDFRAYSDLDTELPPPNNILLLGVNPGSANVYEEWALFGNATLNLTDNFALSGGLRVSENDSGGCYVGDTGIYGHGGVYACQERPAESVTTWMTNARYTFDDGAMLYARIATGYRPGGGCDTCGNDALEIPGLYDADTLTAYEIGYRGDFLDRRLRIDISAFHIDWEEIQLTVTNSLGLNYAGNGGTAVSDGVEAVASYTFDFGLRAGVNVAHTHARLTEDAPGVGGADGDPLPISPRWAGAITLDYSRDLSSGARFFTGLGYHYRDTTYNSFRSSPRPFPLEEQNILDAHAGLELGDATLRLFARNLLNDRSYQGLQYGGNPTRPSFVPVQPRTIGLSVDYNF